MTDAIPDDATEIVEARLPRADLVKMPAHGMPFFIAKSAADDTLDGAVASPKLGDERPAIAPGDPDDPTSAAWEAVDAANARAAVNTLVELKCLVADLLSRESLESITVGDPEDSENAYDLDGVLCALDCALSVLAPFAVTEQAEADDRSEDALVKSSGLVTFVAESICKAGRVLSSANESAIRNAVESLSKVLDSLPSAKEADMTKADETVEPTTEDVAKVTAGVLALADAAEGALAKADETAEPVEPVAKADDLSSLSDDDLKRLAITGEDNERAGALAEIGLRVLTGATAEEDPADDTADPAEVDPDAAGSDADGDPNDVTKSTEETDEAPVDPIQKALADQKTEFDSVVKALQDRVNALEESPAPTRVLSNGAVPPERLLRGQDAAPDPVAKAVEMANSLTDPDARQEVLTRALRGRYES